MVSNWPAKPSFGGSNPSPGSRNKKGKNMKQKIVKAFLIAKRIVTTFADNYGMTDFRSRICTFEDDQEQPFAEILLVFKDKVLKQTQIQEGGLTWTKNVDSEAEAIDDVYNVATEISNKAAHLVWLGE